MAKSLESGKCNEASMSEWSEFEEALASGEDITILLGLDDEETDDKEMHTKNILEEPMKVRIGGEEFKLKLSTPSLDDILMKKDAKLVEEFLVPPPYVPLSEVLPLKQSTKN
uniref:uncharacterized protein LOC120327738 isoform X1 n=1 Tax=Styela clava TaxID=7725 RepID=UPI00193AD53E|nr:uncharacterized protein LOC120327738 isoform X1 [Styela clava]